MKSLTQSKSYKTCTNKVDFYHLKTTMGHTLTRDKQTGAISIDDYEKMDSVKLQGRVFSVKENGERTMVSIGGWFCWVPGIGLPKMTKAEVKCDINQGKSGLFLNAREDSFMYE